MSHGLLIADTVCPRKATNRQPTIRHIFPEDDEDIAEAANLLVRQPTKGLANMKTTMTEFKLM